MLWHDNMQALLTAESVDYRIYLPFGRKAAVVGSAPCQAGEGSPPWAMAANALHAVIEEEMPRRMRIEILLSDRFVHYQVLPWRAGISSRAEWRAYAQHQFEAVYGEAARNWRMRLEIVPPGRESLACAIETDLIDALREAAHAGLSRIATVRPNFISCFGQRRTALRGTQFWFAVVEAHHVCLGAFRNGYWVALRNEPAPDGWRAALAGMLRRAQCTLAEPCAGNLYVCGATGEDIEPFAIDATTVRLLPARTTQRQTAEQAGLATD